MSPVQTKASLQTEIDRLYAGLLEVRGDNGRPRSYHLLQENLRLLKRANEHVREEAERWQKEAERLHFQVHRLKVELEEAQTAGGSPKPERFSDANIDPGMLDRLIRLAHPDRHGGSAMANQVTAWLLKQREQH